MSTVMLKKWGNSAGFIMPSEAIKAAKAYIGEKFELSTKDNGIIVLKPLNGSRSGWLEAINNAHDQDVDLDLQNAVNEFDDNEWTW